MAIENEFLHLTLSFYFVLFIFDAARATRDYNKHALLLFKKPAKTWWCFFAKEHQFTAVCTTLAFLYYVLFI